MNSPHLRLLCCILQLADALAQSLSVASVATPRERCRQDAGARTIPRTRDCMVFATFTNAVSSFECQCIVRHLDPPYQILGLTDVN